MKTLIINMKLHGYETLPIDTNFDNIKDTCSYLVVTSESTDLPLFYKATEKLLDNGNRVILLGTQDCEIFKPLASLMLLHKAYDIYTIPGPEILTPKYIGELQNREPDISEVRNFVGGDLTAKNEVTTLIYGIQSLVDSGNVGALNEFLETHMQSIENLTTMINGLIKKEQMFDSNELFDRIEQLQSTLSTVQKDFGTAETELGKVTEELRKANEAVEKQRTEINKLKEKNAELVKENANGDSILKEYTTVNTKLINNRTKVIIYFKEISYVRYTNTLVMQLLSFLDVKKLKVKLVIYDTQTKLYASYKPLITVSGKNYAGSKDTIINKSKAFVVTEPNTSILQDILTSEQCFDVVIVYDRMKQPSDLVDGNTVTKFFVINSKKEYDALKSTLKINPNSNIITDANSSINTGKGATGCIYIPSIDGFSQATDSAKSIKYVRLSAPSMQDSTIFKDICTRARINALGNLGL